MNRRILWLAAVLLGIFYGCDFGSAPGGGTGVDGLTGILVDSKGNGIAGAKVRVYPAEALAKGAATAAAKADSTTTDNKGAFRFKDLPDGRYDLEASITRQDTVYSLFIRGIDFAGELDLGRDTLRASGSLKVQVRTAAGAVVGIPCSLVGTPWTTVSDSAGKCVFTGLAPGAYQVSTTVQGRTFTTEILTVTSAQATGGRLDVALGGSGGGGQIPSNWVVERALEYAFYRPPELELQSTGYGADSWYAEYKSPSVTLNIEAGFVRLLQRPDTLPGYYADTLSLDSNVRAIYIAYRHPTSGLKAGLQVEKRTGSSTSYMIFNATGTSAADSAQLAMMLRSIQVWKGVVPPPPPAPVLVLPDPNAIGENVSPVFRWSLDSQTDSWRLEVSTDSLFTTLAVEELFLDPEVVGIYYWFRLTEALEFNTRYFWRMKAVNAAGFTTSETRSFTTRSAFKPAMPPVPALRSPSPGDTLVSLFPALTWGVLADGPTMHFKAQLSTDSLFETFVAQDTGWVDYPIVTGGVYSRDTGPLDTKTRYYWRVLATTPGDIRSDASISETRTFKTQ